MDAVLERRTVSDEMERQARRLASTAYLWARRPDRRYQIPPVDLGENPRVDLVCLAGKRRKALHLLRVGDLDRPAREHQGVMDEAGTVHRLHHRHRLRTSIAFSHVPEEVTKAIPVRRPHRDLQTFALLVYDVHVKTRPAQVHPEVQHGVRVVGSDENPTIPPAEAPLHGIQKACPPDSLPFGSLREADDQCSSRTSVRPVSSYGCPRAVQARSLTSARFRLQPVSGDGRCCSSRIRTCEGCVPGAMISGLSPSPPCGTPRTFSCETIPAGESRFDSSLRLHHLRMKPPQCRHRALGAVLYRRSRTEWRILVAVILVGLMRRSPIRARRSGT